MAETKVNVCNKFWIGKEKMAVLLLNQIFDEFVGQGGNFYIVTCRR